jgi:hypothetical protein
MHLFVDAQPSFLFSQGSKSRFLHENQSVWNAALRTIRVRGGGRFGACRRVLIAVQVNPNETNESSHYGLRYTLPTRYCDSDKLLDFAWQNFGHLPHGIERVLGIINWLHRNIEYRTLSGSPNLSARQPENRWNLFLPRLARERIARTQVMANIVSGKDFVCHIHVPLAPTSS